MKRNLVFVAVLIQGCTTLNDQVVQINDNATPRIFTYVEKLGRDEAVNLLVSGLTKPSGMPIDWHAQAVEAGYKKIVASYDDKNVYVEYQHAEYANEKGYKVSSTTYTLPYSVTELEDGKTNVKIYPIVDAKVITSLGYLPIPVKQYAELDKMTENTRKMFSEFKPDSAKRLVQIGNEVESEYPARAIAANFKRFYGCNVEVEKKTNCETTAKNDFYVELYPHKNGSITKYFVNAYYEITSNQGTTIESARKSAAADSEEIKASIYR